MSTTKKTAAKTAAKKTGANAKGANSKGANSRGANSRGGANSNRSGALKPSEMAKALGLTRVGFNQWKNKENVVVARTDGNKLAATKKGSELKFDPMAEFGKLNK
jgi:hypothetical protein